MKGQSKKYFLCTGKTHKKVCTGVKPTIYVSDMEDMIDECISKKFETLRLSNSHRDDENAVQINELKLKLNGVEKKISSLSDVVLSGELNSEMIALLNEKAKKLTEDKRKLLEAIDELTITAVDPKETINFAKRWKKAEFREKRAICNVLIKTIIMSEDGNPKIIWNI